MIRQAVFLVGGRGTRLGAVTDIVPKPLVLVGGRPFLDILIDNLARFGIEDIVLVCGYLGEQFVARYDGTVRGGARVRCIVEPEPAGTGGALRIAAPHLDPTFLVCNGDSLFDINILDLARLEAPEGWIGKLALRRMADAGRYGAIVPDGDRITAFAPRGPARPGLINGGVYLLNRDVLDWIDRMPCSIEADVFPRLAAAGRLFGREMAGFFIDIGIPSALAEAQTTVPAHVRRPAAFLDRDGVLNTDIGYLHRVEDLVWQPGAHTAVKRLNDAGYWVFVVTNQAGVARGYYDETAVHRLHRAMNAELHAVGAHIDAFYHCPHHPDGTVPEYRGVCRCRKPAPGLIEAALADWSVDLTGSFLIGGKPSDIEAAGAAGLAARLFQGDRDDLADLVGDLIAARGAADLAATP